MAVGCLLFAPAASLGVFGGFLFALFVMAAGITILQVAANPLIAILGTRETSPSRLTLAQAFNSLGTTIGPFVGAAFILAANAPPPAGAAPALLDAYRHAEAQAVQTPFLGIAVVLIVLSPPASGCSRRAAASFPDKPERAARGLGAAEEAAPRFGRAVDLSLCRRRGLDRQPAHQLPDAGQHARRRCGDAAAA